MRKVAILLFVLLQASAYAGFACGNHLTAAETMDCCKKGHTDPNELSISDSDANACCGSCEIGRNQAIKRQDRVLSLNDLTVAPAVLPTVCVVTVPEVASSEWSEQKFILLKPPEILLLTQSFRI